MRFVKSTAQSAFRHVHLGFHVSSSENSAGGGLSHLLYRCQVHCSSCSFLSFVWKGNFRYGAILGVVLGVAYTAQTWGLTLTTSTKSGFITSLYIVFVPIFAYFIEKEVPTPFQIVSFLVGSLGLYMISGRIEGLNLGTF